MTGCDLFHQPISAGRGLRGRAIYNALVMPEIERWLSCAGNEECSASASMGLLAAVIQGDKSPYPPPAPRTTEKISWTHLPKQMP